MNTLEKIKELLNNEQISEAIDLIINSEENYLDSEEYWNLRGLTCFQINQFELSEESFKRTLEINEKNIDANYNLAYIYNQLGFYSEAALFFGLVHRYTDDDSLKEELDTFYLDDPCENIYNTAKQNKKNTFIILSNIRWSKVQQRVHHIAKSLAKFGHTVYFIDPKVELEMDNHKDIKKLALANSLESTYTSGTLQVFTPIVVRDLNTGLILEDSLIPTIEELINNYNNSDEKPVIITYHPDYLETIEQLNSDYKLIYDCVDDHSDSEVSFWGGEDCVVKENQLMNKADFITTTATSLFIERAVLQNRKNVYLSKNAVNEKDFTILEEFEPDDLKNIPHPRIVYSGFIYDRFDEKLFYDAVKSNPDKSFVIIGNIGEGMLEKEEPNLYKLGIKDHCDLKNYLNNCDVGIVPHLEKCDMDIACDSIKQYEFLASGLEVITTFVPESTLNKIRIHPINNLKEFNEQLNLCLKNKDNIESIQELPSFLAENSWNNRASVICSLVNGTFTSKELEEVLEGTRKALEDSSKTNDKGIIKCLNTLAKDITLDDKVKELEKIYSKDKDRYIERMYVRLLVKVNELKKAHQVLIKSNYIKTEVRKQLSTIDIFKNTTEFKVLAAISTKDFTNAIESIDLLEDEDTKNIYTTYINLRFNHKLQSDMVKSIKSIKSEQPLATYVKSLVNSMNSDNLIVIGDNTAQSKMMIDEMKNNISITEYYSFEDIKNLSKEDNFYKRAISKNSKIVVLGSSNYPEIIKTIVSKGINQCSLAIRIGNSIHIENIPTSILEAVRNKDYERNVLLIHTGSVDTNLHAIHKLIPENYKGKYNPILLHYDNLGDKIWRNFIPLIANITVSGHASVYWELPPYTHHIEVWHAGLSLKTCGLMDKEDKNSGIGDLRLFKRANTFCVASHLDMMIKNSWFALSEDVYEIIGQPRTDLLYSANGKANLSKVVNRNLNDKKVILNMPTFHSRKNGKLDGSADLNESIKIRKFDYEKFNEFLVANDIVFISKVHPVEAIAVHNSMKKYNKEALSNIIFLTNEDLDANNFSIYEILNGADVLVTDYSSVYSDFLLLDRPVIFVNTDLDEYRARRGISLEPYDYWTAGPKVQTQDKFQEEILLCSNNKDYYKEQRQNLIPLFHAYTDDKATYRFWELIDSISNKIN